MNMISYGAGKILIVSLRAGLGHVKAAEAVEVAAREKMPKCGIKNIDLLDYSSEMMKFLYGKAYLDMLKIIPELYAYVYKNFDAAKKFVQPRLIADRFNFHDLFGMVEKFDPDVVVATHFIPASILENYRRKKNKTFKIAVTLTDYEFHPLWAVPNVDMFFVATEEVRESLLFYGVGANSINTTGIPVNPKFAEKKNVAEIKRKLGFSEKEGLIILFSAGSFGVTPLSEVLKTIDKHIGGDFQIVAVCGKNKKLDAELNKKMQTSTHIKKVFGFADNMDEIMTASDILVTKPGGIITSESIALSLPMIFIDPIPGQEEANADYFIEQGAALKARNLASLIYKLQELIQNTTKISAMKKNAKKIARPNAARDVANIILDL